MFDAMLAFATVLGVLALTWARLPDARASRAGWLGFGAALALGVLAKGPVILVHLLPVALLMPVWAEGSGWGRTLRGIGLAIATALVLLALWLVPALIQGGAEYRQAVLWTQSAGRVSGSFGHGRPWWFYLPLLPLLLWPWIWSLDVWRGLRRIALRSPAPIWAAATLVVFSLIGGKQPHYLLPALPAAALIFGEILGGAGAVALRARPAGLLPAALGVVALAAAAGFGPGKALALGTPVWAVAGFAGTLPRPGAPPPSSCGAAASRFSASGWSPCSIWRFSERRGGSTTALRRCPHRRPRGRGGRRAGGLPGRVHLRWKAARAGHEIRRQYGGLRVARCRRYRPRPRGNPPQGSLGKNTR